MNSVPQGALLKLDGQEVGTTPKIVQVAAGKHRLEFSKEGFNPGAFPVEIGPDDASGGSVSYELGTSVHDTVELRDGTVINGDVESVSTTEVAVRIAGKDASYARNQVKRVSFVERESSQEALRPPLRARHLRSRDRTFQPRLIAVSEEMKAWAAALGGRSDRLAAGKHAGPCLGSPRYIAGNRFSRFCRARAGWGLRVRLRSNWKTRRPGYWQASRGKTANLDDDDAGQPLVRV